MTAPLVRQPACRTGRDRSRAVASGGELPEAALRGKKLWTKLQPEKGIDLIAAQHPTKSVNKS